MNWILLENENQIEDIKSQSFEHPIVIFKHSTRCSISSMAKNRLERDTEPDKISFYYLDLLKHRNVSNLVADIFSVHHESPQIILVKNGECVYEESHNGINMDEIKDQINKLYN